MYTNDKCRIKIGNTLSDIIYPNRGVRQGCVLSPLLFNIFLADLPKSLNNTEQHTPVLGEQKKIACIIWADDLVIFSESEEGLNKMLRTLATYADQNSLKINVDKTKAMIFNKTGKLIRRNFRYKDKLISTVREYKYLGFVLTPSGEIVTGLQDLKDRASRATNLLRAKMGYYFRKDPITTLKLFNAFIKPILLYMADFWGYLKMPHNNPIENTQMRFLKQLLGVQTQTANIGVLLELGEVPISLHAKKMCIKNWERIKKKQCNFLVRTSFENATKNGLIWDTRVRDGLREIGLAHIYLQDNTERKMTEFFFIQRVTDIFHQNAFADMKREDSKLRTYSRLKTKNWT